MKAKMRLIFTVVLAFSLGLAHNAAADDMAAGCDHHSLLLFIGDGMGLAQINAARLSALGVSGRLHMERLPVIGLMRTHALDELITDSAASATAMSGGIKTRNGRIGEDADGRAVIGIMELAADAGLATGVVATSSVTHATPASFYAHVRERSMEAEIAEQLLASDIDLALGGGTGFFLPSSHKDSLREDRKDLLKLAMSKDFQIVRNLQQLSSARTGQKLLGLFATEGMRHEAGEPTLEQMTQAALAHLSAQDRGFILMVEGSQIDWGGHSRNEDMVIDELLAFDAAVAHGHAFARENACTLMLVTADHETGGLTIVDGKTSGGKPDLEFQTRHHTGVDVPVFAYGPGADAFAGIIDNTDIARLSSRILGLGSLPQRVRANAPIPAH